MEMILTILGIGIVSTGIMYLINESMDRDIYGKKPDMRKIANSPYLYFEGTKLDKYIKNRIKEKIDSAIFDHEIHSRIERADLYKLANKLGYEKREAGEWVKRK